MSTRGRVPSRLRRRGSDKTARKATAATQRLVRHRAAWPRQRNGRGATPTLSSMATVNVGPHQVYRDATLAPHRWRMARRSASARVGARSVTAAAKPGRPGQGSPRASRLCRLVDRVNRLTQSEAWAKPQLRAGATAIDQADVANEVELGDREARHAEPERERQDRLCHRVWNLHGLAAELLVHRRQRDLARPDDVVDAAAARRERGDDRVRRVL